MRWGVGLAIVLSLFVVACHDDDNDSPKPVPTTDVTTACRAATNVWGAPIIYVTNADKECEQDKFDLCFCENALHSCLYDCSKANASQMWIACQRF